MRKHPVAAILRADWVGEGLGSWRSVDLRLQTFETETLAEEENFTRLARSTAN